jgi:large subunit ribosomal protein L29
MKPVEIRKLSVEEIQAKLDDSREELMKLRFQQVTGQLTDTSRVRLLRRDIARMQTIAQELAGAPVVEVVEEAPVEKPKAKARSKAKVEVEKPKAKASSKAKAEVEKPKAKASSKAKAEKEAEEGEA